MPETVKGIVDRYIFFNEENGYSIIKLKDTSVIVGTLPKLNQGESIEVSGNWIVHPKFGKQFKIENFSIAYPTTKTGVINYLGSGLIKGIGKSTAEKIYSVFGTKTLDILEKNIHRLLEVEGIGETKRHTKPSQTNPQGGIVEGLRWWPASRFRVCDSKGIPLGRVGFKVDGKKKERVFSKTR